jgi:signal peptidase II
MKKWWLCLFLILCLDMGTKWAALQWIPQLGFPPFPFGGIPIFSLGGITCSLNTIANTGAAWGTFAEYPGLLFMVRILIILALVILIPKRFPIWLVLTGALGNVIDYCLYEKVIDFIHFTFWGYSFPIFNVADSCITIGVISLFLFRDAKKEVSSL